MPSLEARSPSVSTATSRLKDEGAGLELRIGEFGLAWVGSAILFLGIVFLMAYAQSLGHRAIASATGYATTVGLYFAASFWSRSNRYLSRVLLSSSLLLLYYTTMRLGFFSAAPLIANAYAALLLLIAVVAIQLTFAARRNSESLAITAILLGSISALLIDRTRATLPLVAANAAVAVFLAMQRDWRLLVPAAIIFAYAAHLLWLMGNPVAGHQLQAVAEHQYNIVYLFMYAVIFYWPLLARKKSPEDDAHTIVAVLLNSLGFSMIMALAVLNHFQSNFAAIYLGVAAFFLLLSIVQWLTTHHQFSPAIYACFGYMALSVAIYGYARLPTSFLWLSLQSLLVVSMALWFRSRTLVVMNSLIYVSILLAYFAVSPSSNGVNFSFAFVALASARVMNWQKERLTLRTEMLRNVYLAIAFVLVFYALHRAVPAQYVTLSWTVTAVIYFLISYLLDNIKYRWMAISGMLVTIVYLFLVDLSHLDPVYRVAAFLFLGLMALVVSLFYTRTRRLMKKQNQTSGKADS